MSLTRDIPLLLYLRFNFFPCGKPGSVVSAISPLNLLLKPSLLTVGMRRAEWEREKSLTLWKHC